MSLLEERERIGLLVVEEKQVEMGKVDLKEPVKKSIG
jgi:hypothetical protein